jgi:hypothetical protein
MVEWEYVYGMSSRMHYTRKGSTIDYTWYILFVTMYEKERNNHYFSIVIEGIVIYMYVGMYILVGR